MVEFKVLGPLEVRIEGRLATLTSRRERAVLAVLLINANRLTPIDRLLAALWSDEPPDSAVGQIQTLIWRLRGRLGSTGDTIVTRPGGYQLVVPPGALDAEVFVAAVAEATRLAKAEQYEEAAQRFDAALALWRGAAFGDVALPGDADASGLHAAVAELAEQRLAAERDHIDVELALGRHASLVPKLQHLLRTEPLREELRERLMLALYRCGRRAEALEVYRQGRELLVSELGLEPGGQLQRLQARVLAADPELDGTTDAGQGAVSQLPVDVADFVARAELVAELTEILTRRRPTTMPTTMPTTPATVVISGVAGAGKTALAVHVAHRVRVHFPDGQLFADVRGGHDPLPPTEVLARFLRALGEDVRTLPADADERAALFRARTAGRRLLVVLDNAAGEAQIRPLLPAEPRCAVLITSRPRLAALSGAHQVDLGVFSPAEALDLLRRTAGAERVEGKTLDCARVVDRCGYLPLAIRIAGARLAARPHWPIATLADQLANEHARLDVLCTGDLAVRSSLAASYRTLAEPEQRAFRLLGALDVPDFAAWVAAPLLAIPVAQGEELVERLVEARLLEAAGGRYRFHDLVRAYARELLAGQPQVPAALGRAFGAWLALAEAADARLPGGFRSVAKGAAPRWPGWTDAELAALLADPVAWCEAERPALVAVVRQAAAAGLDELAWDLACTLGRFFELREHLDDWRRTHGAALLACRTAGNHRGEAYLLRALGEMHLDTDRLDEALACFQPALSILTALADRQGQALVLRAQGTAYRLLGRDEDAMASLRRALAVCAELDDQVGRAQVLHNMGIVHRRAGRLDAAEASYREALALFAGIGDRFGQAYVLCSLGIVVGVRDVAAAEQHLGSSVELCSEVGYRRGEALALGHLGELHLRVGAHQQAADELRAAVAGCQEVGDGPGEAIGLRRLGELYRAVGNGPAARVALHRSLAMFHSFDLPDEQAKAMRCLVELDAELVQSGLRST